MLKKLFYLFVLTFSLGFVFTACNNAGPAKTEQLAADEVYTCEMHQDVLSDHGGKCPKCGMNLVKQKMTNEQRKSKASGNFIKPKE